MSLPIKMTPLVVTVLPPIMSASAGAGRVELDRGRSHGSLQLRKPS